MENLFHLFKRAAAINVMIFCCGAMAGCTAVAPSGKGEPSAERRLTADVQFLAQPALKGRKSGTRGSRLAREFIKTRFKECGLVPWGSEKDFEQSFGLGNNIIGVLPGSDTNLAKEIVLLSAHYDHVGKSDGKIHPGAGDNAAGVAALLEAAKELSRQRPKRSVAFAAFDREEDWMLGSFAFSWRKDVTNAPIVAVVNVDMLGRDFLDVVRHTLFVAGAEKYPDLRHRILLAGTNAGMRVLPIGTDIVGPRSDHIAFEHLDVPCVFFSCGTYRDYHLPTDTPDKLNYGDIQHSTGVIVETVRDLADRDGKEASDLGNFPVEELGTMRVVLSEAAGNASEAGIQKADLEDFQKLAARVRELENSGRYSPEERERMATEAAGILAPYTMPMGTSGGTTEGPDRDYSRLSMQFFQNVCFNYRPQVVSASRLIVKHLVRYQPGAFRRMPRIYCEIFRIEDRDIHLTDRGNGKFDLNVLAVLVAFSLEVKPSRLLINAPSGGINATMNLFDCSGTRDEIIDYCLLQLRAERANPGRPVQVKKVLARAAGTSTDADYPELLSQRLARGGFKDETDWIVSCQLSANPDLALEAMSLSKGNPDRRMQQAACRIIVDRAVRSDVRGKAIGFAAKSADKQALLACCDVLSDATLVTRPEYLWWCRDDYVFADRPAVKLMNFGKEKWPKSPEWSKTIGDLAKVQLKKASGKDFGNDVEKWRKWVEARFK